MHFSSALAALSFATFAVAGSHNYLNLYADPQCRSTPYAEVGIYNNDECYSTMPQKGLAQSVSTVLIEPDCYVLGYQQANCTGSGIIVSSTDPNTCISASPINGIAGYFRSLMLKNCQ